MKNIILLIVSVIINNIASAQNRLSGNIKDAHNQSVLSNVIIRIPDLKLSCISDMGGNYNFKDISAGTYLIEVSLTGYETKLETVIVKGSINKDFFINPSIKELQQVNVTGVINATDKRKNPVSIISFSYQDILQNTSTNVIDAIANLPGVSAVTSGQSISKPVIRGLGYNRVLTIDDGGLMNLELKQTQML
jgi:iron complex outermembrane recepter protein